MLLPSASPAPEPGPRPEPDEGWPSWSSLRPLLRPRGIAVVGASADTDKFTGRIIPSLQACGYAGAIYPVNPRYERLGNLPCYPSPGDVPDPCDLAIIAVPARHVVAVTRQAAERGVGAAVILSAGFDEIGGEGLRRSAALRALVTGPDGIRIYGPNCPGLWQIRDGLVYTFSSQFEPSALRPGPVGLVTQGGALGRAVLDAMETGLGFSFWFSTGNELDLDASTFIALLADDPDTRVVAAVLEGWRDGVRFLRAAQRCRQAGKPLVLLKIGTSTAGALAALRHTAARGQPPLSHAQLRAVGCLPVEDIGELTDAARLLARYPHPPAPPAGPGICTFSGGAGGLLADQLTGAGIAPPDLAPATASALRALLPDIASVGNPTDLTTAVFQDPDLACHALTLLAADPGIGLLLFPLPHRHDAFDAILAQALATLAPGLAKPLAIVAVSPTFEQEKAAHILLSADIPVLPSCRRAARATATWLAYGADRHAWRRSGTFGTQTVGHAP